MSSTYIGDGVYVEFDGYQIRVTTNNGIETLQEIFLEREVAFALMNYLQMHFKFGEFEVKDEK